MTEELKKILSSAGKTDVTSAKHYLLEQLKLLQQNGDLELGYDKDLTGISLELRVKQLFQEIDLNIIDGRPGQEDFVVIADHNSKHKDNIVIEVKSSRKPNIMIDDLRQLDDWVFDLSDEEKARKHGLGGGFNALALATQGFISSPKRHPTPHKGLLVFNGPIGTPFEERNSSILSPNQIDFVQKRNFCVISINHLVTLLEKDQETAWCILHEIIGEYRDA